MDGPIAISIEGAEEEVRIGGGVWGNKGAGWGVLGPTGSKAPGPGSPTCVPTCVLGWASPFPLQHQAFGRQVVVGKVEVEVRVPFP